jgi:hypothetical protein
VNRLDKTSKVCGTLDGEGRCCDGGAFGCAAVILYAGPLLAPVLALDSGRSRWPVAWGVAQ